MTQSTRAPVLVLNQNYQPLNICDIRRAVKLVGKGKAESVQDTGEYVHTVTDIFERPDVIRLVYMVKRPLQRRKMSRNEIFTRDNQTCQYCGIRSRDMTIDHIRPRCKGGEYTWMNVVTACKKCIQRSVSQKKMYEELLFRQRYEVGFEIICHACFDSSDSRE